MECEISKGYCENSLDEGEKNGSLCHVEKVFMQLTMIEIFVCWAQNLFCTLEFKSDSLTCFLGLKQIIFSFGRYEIERLKYSFFQPLSFPFLRFLFIIFYVL